MFKLYHSCTHFKHLQNYSQNSQYCSKFSKQGFDNMWTVKFQMFKLDLEKAEEPEIKLPTSTGSSKKQESYRKTSMLYLLRHTFDCVDNNKLWKILKEMGRPDHFTCLLRNMYAGQEATVRTRHGPTDWFQIEKGVCQVVYCRPTYLTYMQSTSCEIPGWTKHKLESRLPEEISIIPDRQMTPPFWQKAKKN